MIKCIETCYDDDDDDDVNDDDIAAMVGRCKNQNPEMVRTNRKKTRKRSRTRKVGTSGNVSSVATLLVPSRLAYQALI
ncbi:unnamed protein product [Periconia digitata]|uniref:Uncharacterized protein n=1 Tax=Periconia digitata TaxID=1303443 RepID=A0A9W4UHC5_9PLEO|nr:unnamed protein product [Periconia digitata]